MEYEKRTDYSTPIQSILCQMIKEPIKKIVLENGIVLKCTLKHRLLKLVNVKQKIYYWDNQLQENDIIAIQDKNLLQHARIQKIIIEEYEGYVFDLVIPKTHNYVVNGILSHNTSVPIIHNSIPKYFKFTKSQKKNINLIICPACRLSWWQENSCQPLYLLNHKSHTLSEDKIKVLKSVGGQIICSYNYLESNISQIINLKIAVLKIDFIPMELEAKKTNIFWTNLEKIKAHIGWTIVNYKNLFCVENEIWCKIVKLYGINSDSNSVGTDKIFFERKNSKKLKIKNIELTFGQREMDKYEDYIKKFAFIYQKNEILFQEDVFLQKYCSYPQSNLKINYFSLDSSVDDNIVINSQNLLRKLGNYSKNLISSIETLHQNGNYSVTSGNLTSKDNYDLEDSSCNICLQTMKPNNLGITECGHLFCYSCLLKNMKYQKKCPRCRSDIDSENIYLYSHSSKHDELSHQHIIEECQDELNLGTKISSLLKLVMNLKKSKIVISNFDDNLKYIQDILTQFKITSILVNHKNYSKIAENPHLKDEKIVYLINYKFKFYKLPYLTHIRSIICNEPWYCDSNMEESKNILISKLQTLRGIYPKSTIYNLYIKNTIEETQIEKLIA